MPAPVTGTLFNQTSAVTSFTVSYAPTTGNTLIICVLLHGPAVTSLQDNLGNTYTPDATFGSSAIYHINSAPAGITGFTVSEASAATGVVAIEEYSGAVGAVLVTGAGSTTSQTGASGRASVSDYLVAVAISGAAIASITNATSRQNGGNNADFIEIGDNGPLGATTFVTFSYSASSFSGLWVYLVGGTSVARASQDLSLVAKSGQPKARVSQDLTLVPHGANPLARVSQDITLVLAQSRKISMVSQDITLVLVKNAPTTTVQPFGFVMT